ncbi:hypothetical protein JXA12_03075 [Candidatus Woesearchaeota archaeon]|nr:hypothetical protein [Candidatus Woesearchaeota archaeon]
MASIDLGFFGNFSIIFTFLLVYVIVYGILEMRKPFGADKRNLNALLGTAVAVLVVVSGPMVSLVNYIIPWFLIIALIVFFILFALGIFGQGVDFSDLARKKQISTWIIVLAVVVLLFGIGNAFGQSKLEQGGWDGTEPVNTTNSGEDDPTGLKNTGTDGSSVATSDFATNVVNTLFNPKVLGLMLILLVAVFAMFFLSD